MVHATPLDLGPVIELTSDDEHELAMDYVLGSVDGDARAAIRRHADRDRRLADAIAALDRRLAPLADLVPEEAPPASVWARIEHAITDTNPADPVAIGLTVFGDQGSWRPVTRGVEMKLLSNGGPEGLGTYLLRCRPGARLPAHTHDHAEEMFMVWGDAELGALRLSEGDYHRMPPGSTHPVIRTRGGCVVFMRGSLAMRAPS